MNRVHEQYPKIDSGTVLSQTWVKNRLSALSAQPWPAHAPSAYAQRLPVVRAPRLPAAGPAPAYRAPATCPRQRAPLLRAQPARPAPSLLLKWAVAHFRFYTPFFFPIYFQLLENTKKIYTYFFFHFLGYSNKF